MRIPDRKDRNYLDEDTRYDEIVDFINQKAIGSVEQFFESIVRVFKWLPIIWKDRDWDYSYLLRIMRFKMMQMEPVLRNGHHTCCEEDAKSIRVCIAHLDRFFDIYKYTEPYNFDYEFVKEENGLYRMELKWSKRDQILAERTHKLEEWHWEQFCKKFVKNIRRWWD